MRVELAMSLVLNPERSLKEIENNFGETIQTSRIHPLWASGVEFSFLVSHSKRNENSVNTYLYGVFRNSDPVNLSPIWKNFLGSSAKEAETVKVSNFSVMSVSLILSRRLISIKISSGFSKCVLRFIQLNYGCFYLLLTWRSWMIKSPVQYHGNFF